MKNRLTKKVIIRSMVIGGAIMAILNACTSTEVSVEQLRINRETLSASYQDGRYTGMGAPFKMSMMEYASSTWDYVFNEEETTPSDSLPREIVNLSYFNDTGTEQLNVTWLGHSSLMINIDGYKVLTDPVFEKRISIIGPTRFNGDVPLDISELPSIDVVIVSHNHYDHLNEYSIRQLSENTSQFIVPLSVGSQLIEWGVSPDKIIELDWWDEHRYDHNLTIAATPARHFSGRGLFDHGKTLWASWVIMTDKRKLFFSGDSGYFEGLKKIGDEYGPFDMTFIECGAYNEAWPEFHMFPEQTVQAHRDLKGDVLHPIHWATFDLALHSWYEPMERLTNTAAAEGISVATPKVGETTIYGETIPTEKWW